MNAHHRNKTKRGFPGFKGVLVVGILILVMQISRLNLFSQSTSATAIGLTPQETEEAITLLDQIKQQRAQINENETKITVRLAEIAEDIRQTRIFAAKATR